MPSPAPPPELHPQSQPQPTQLPRDQDPRFSFTYILNTPTPTLTSTPHHPKPTLQHLPQEIRRTIWNCARSRTIGIIISSDLISSRSPSPVTFRINRESRNSTKIHYKIHPRFYILGTEFYEKIHYPFFDPEVDSVVLVDAFVGGNAAMSTVFGGYGADAGSGRRSGTFRDGYREMGLEDPLDVVQRLHIPAHALDWRVIGRTLRANMRFKNLREIVLRGGERGLITTDDIERSEEENDDVETGRLESTHPVKETAERLADRERKVPEIKVFMPKGLDYEWMFEEEKLGMESIEERKWVMNFIRKVKADRR
ncbi:hypothetical protein EAF04_000894 [Stromatinia cepivora]|nr:hypothetical protein EAF04_000894 [Stromatinia cepivora]